MNILDELIEYLPNAHRYDRYIACRCIFHSPDNNPSLFIYEDGFRCASCGKFGNTQQLLNQLKNNRIPFKPTISNNIQPRNPFTNWINKFGSLAKVCWIAHQQAIKNPHHITYLTQKRGLTMKTVKELGLGVLNGWYTIPFKDGRKVLGATSRVGQHAPYRLYVNPKGQSPDLLYVTDYDRVQSSDKIYLTFGIFDAITLYQLGLASMSTTTGKRLNPEALDKFRKPIYIIPDVGEEKEGHKLAGEIGWRGKVMELPQDGKKDVSDIYTHNPQTLLNFLGV